MPLSRIKVGGDTIKGFPSDQVPSSSAVVRYKGPIDFTYLYREVQRWFEERRFRFYDTRHKDSGKRVKVDLQARRDLDEFFAEEYKIKIEMWNLTTQEILVNGEPRKILNGQAQFVISGAIITDRAGFFKGKGRLLQWLGYLYNEMRWREIESKYIDMMEYRTQDIQILIKRCLNMITKENAAW